MQSFKTCQTETTACECPSSCQAVSSKACAACVLKIPFPHKLVSFFQDGRMDISMKLSFFKMCITVDLRVLSLAQNTSQIKRGSLTCMGRSHGVLCIQQWDKPDCPGNSCQHISQVLLVVLLLLLANICVIALKLCADAHGTIQNHHTFHKNGRVQLCPASHTYIQSLFGLAQMP